MDCHIAADERMDFRPKKRNNKVGLKSVRDVPPILTLYNLRSLHESINQRICKSRWTHGRCESDKDVDLFIESRMNAKCSEGLCSPLAESNIAELLAFRYFQNVVNGIRNIVPCKIVHTVRFTFRLEG